MTEHTGKETIDYQNGYVYEGNVKDGVPHGVGMMTCEDGRVCYGIWEDGKIIYEGELNGEGKPHGRGTEVYSKRNVYEGGFKGGKRHGKGTYKWPNGAVYKGEYKGGKRNGMGTYKWPNGSVYDGESGKMTMSTARELTNGQVDILTPVNTKAAKLMEKGLIVIKMVMSTMESGVLV